MAAREGDSKTITVDVAARLLMISARRLQQLVSAKWIARPYTVVGVVQGYIKFLQDEERKSSRTVGRAEIDLERARKLKRENDEGELRLIPIEDALATIDAMHGQLKSGFAGVAPRVSDDVLIRRRVEDEIDVVLSAYTARWRKASSALAAGRDPLGAESEDDALAMGAAEPELSAVGGETGSA